MTFLITAALMGVAFVLGVYQGATSAKTQAEVALIKAEAEHTVAQTARVTAALDSPL